MPRIIVMAVILVINLQIAPHLHPNAFYNISKIVLLTMLSPLALLNALLVMSNTLFRQMNYHVQPSRLRIVILLMLMAYAQDALMAMSFSKIVIQPRPLSAIKYTKTKIA